MDAEALVRRIMESNQNARLRFDSQTARIQKAVLSGAWDEIGKVVQEARDDTSVDSEEDRASGTGTVEAGNLDGSASSGLAGTSSGNEPSQPGS